MLNRCYIFFEPSTFIPIFLSSNTKLKKLMADILDLQHDFYYFWDWTAITIQSLLEKSTDRKIITDNLLCESSQYFFDFTDAVNICLIDELLKNNKQSAILLPDNKKSRPTMLFASLLIKHWLFLKKNDKRNSKVLFIGSPLILRHYFKAVKWVFRFKERHQPFYLNFSDFFPKAYISGGDAPQSVQEDFFWDVHLPQILCHYSPTDPKNIIQNYKPECIVINFDNEQKDISWIPSLIQISKEKQIPVLACVQNSLSNALSIIQDLDMDIFYWPRFQTQIIPNEKMVRTHEIDLKNFLIDFYETEPSFIKPIIIQSSNHWLFVRAYVNLIQAKELTQNELTLTAVKIGLRYLRLLEELPIPLKIYESECGNYWGLKRISRIKEAFDKYIETIEPHYPEIFQKLLETSTQLDKIYNEFYWNSDPELWVALKDKIKQDVPENEIRIVVFKVKARQKIFELTLLLKENISSELLEKRRIFITCIKDVQKTLKRIKSPDSFDDASINLDNKKIHSIIIGLPDKQSNPYLEELLFHDSIEFLLYSHLNPVFNNRVEEWNTIFSKSLESNVKILSKTSERKYISTVPNLSNHFLLKKPDVIVSKNISSRKVPQEDNSVAPKEKELMRNVLYNNLLVLTDLENEEDTYFIEDNKNSSETINGSEEIMVNAAIEFQFTSGEKALFSLNDTLKVVNPILNGKIPQTSTIDKLASDVRVGDKILLIRGQKRQNLYDLLISRIHGHPSVDIKLKLIKRWHDEFRTTFEKEKVRNGLTLENLLYSIRKRGSKITSSQTLGLWLSESTIAPIDKEDLRYLADELNLPFVRKYYKEVYAAAQRIRGIHVGFANKLNNWLLNQAKGIVTDENNYSDFIDEELGITLQDFKDSLLMLSVKKVEIKNGLFYKDDLGKLEG